MRKQEGNTMNQPFNNKKQWNKNVSIIIIFIIIFFSIYLLNRMTLLFADDWVYSFVFGTKELTPVKNLLDIIESQYNHYFIWGGRTVVHFIDQLILLCNHNWLSVIKSLCFILLIYIIYRYSYSNNKDRNIYLLIFEVALVYSFYINFEEVMLWTTGAANYLFGTTIMVLFLYPFYIYFIGGLKKKYNALLFFFFGIIAGWTNENTGASLIFILIVLLCYEYKTKSKIPKWIIFGTIGACIGYIFMIAAPGNYERFSLEINQANKSNFSKFEIISSSLNNVVLYYTRFYQIISLYSLYLIGLIYMFFSKKRSLLSPKKIKASVVFFIAGNISSFIMIFSPVFPVRATFAEVTFFIIAVLLIYSELIKYKYFKYYFYCLLFIISLFTLRKYYFIYEKTHQLYIVVQKRDKYIKDQKKQNNLDIVLPSNQLPFSVYYYDFSTDPKSSLNQNFSRYSGLKSIRVKDKNEN